MLSYAYRNIKESDKELFGSEAFDNAADLMAAILAKGLSGQIKRGLQKEYIDTCDILRSPKGKIDVSSTISKQLMLNKQVLCEFDEYTEDTLMNRILKTTAYNLCKSDVVSIEQRKNLKRNLLYLEKVSLVSLKSIHWKEIKFHRNSISYRFLMNICYLVVEGLLMSKKGKTVQFRSFIDDQQMSRLYEKFLLEYFKKHYPMFKVTASFIDWQTDDGIIGFLPQMRSDVTIKYNDIRMIIDAKYYTKISLVTIKPFILIICIRFLLM
jgi:5-methylcytosine-specific restriction enzyme subunit McrC